MKYWITALVMAVLVLAGCGPERNVKAAQLAPETATPTPFGTVTPDDKIGICHRTGSASNPWIYIVIDANAIPAHQQHGDIFKVSSQAQCDVFATATPATGIPTVTPMPLTNTPTGTATSTATATATASGSPVATNTPAPNGNGKVGICHRTGSDKNPYVYIVVSRNAVKAHRKHGDIIGVNSSSDCPATAGNNGKDNSGNDDDRGKDKQNKNKNKDKDKD